MTTDNEFKERVLDSLARMDRWMEGHDKKHDADEAARNVAAIKVENRVSKIESALSSRSLIGVALTALASAIAAFVGMYGHLG